MHITFIGKDPGSQEGHSPTLYATDRSDRQTFLVQGWVVTDRQALSELGDVPAGEAVVEVPVEVLRMVNQGSEEADH